MNYTQDDLIVVDAQLADADAALAQVAAMRAKAETQRVVNEAQVNKQKNILLAKKAEIETALAV